MAKHVSCEAFVLRTYDVGEADRFCILFTRERGRIAARANGVRKLKSRMGGSLLQPAHVTVNLTETKTGFLITSAQLKSDTSRSSDTDFFYKCQQMMELLLALLHDEEPLPDVFELTEKFLLSDMQPLPFSLRLLHLLGLLPESDNSVYTQRLSSHERMVMQQCIDGVWEGNVMRESTKNLAGMCQMLLAEQVSSPLRAQLVATGY